MKSFSLLLALITLFFITSCNNEQQPQNVPNVPFDSLTAKPNPTPKENLMVLDSLNGQYPIEVKFLDNPLIKNRIEKLLGSDYSNFRKYWNVETPIVVEDNVLSTTGCEEHNCGGNQYILQIDLKNNNINIYHFSSKVQAYKENGDIVLPPGIAKDFEIMKSNLVY